MGYWFLIANLVEDRITIDYKWSDASNYDICAIQIKNFEKYLQWFIKFWKKLRMVNGLTTMIYNVT